jgi:hypothetical protein
MKTLLLALLISGQALAAIVPVSSQVHSELHRLASFYYLKLKAEEVNKKLLLNKNIAILDSEKVTLDLDEVSVSDDAVIFVQGEFELNIHKLKGHLRIVNMAYYEDVNEVKSFTDLLVTHVDKAADGSLGGNGDHGGNGDDAGCNFWGKCWGADNGGAGQAGQNGTNGSNGRSGVTGLTGANPKEIKVTIDELHKTGKVTIYSIGGDGSIGFPGQNGGVGGNGGLGANGGRGGHGFAHMGGGRGGNAGNGGQGGKGGDGGNGGIGGNGGDGGKVILEISNLSMAARRKHLEIWTIVTNGGRGGNGGVPGLGAKGGIGGKAGVRGGNASAGNNGANGMNGIKGIKGNEGFEGLKIQPEIVIEGSRPEVNL